MSHYRIKEIKDLFETAGLSIESALNLALSIPAFKSMQELIDQNYFGSSQDALLEMEKLTVEYHLSSLNDPITRQKLISGEVAWLDFLSAPLAHYPPGHFQHESLDYPISSVIFASSIMTPASMSPEATPD
jgi:hypothetical protein